MELHESSVDASKAAATLRHPIWMLIGGVIGLAAAVVGMAITEWLAPGAAGSQSLLLTIMAVVMGAALFRRGVQGVPPVWPLVGFPLMLTTVVFLSGIGRTFVTPGGSSPVATVLIFFVLASTSYARSKQKPPTPQAVRRGLAQMAIVMSILVMACTALTVAAYQVPLPAVQAALPNAAASAFGVWCAMSIVAICWIAASSVHPSISDAHGI